MRSEKIIMSTKNFPPFRELLKKIKFTVYVLLEGERVRKSRANKKQTTLNEKLKE
jgi:hypothetical protein